MPKREAQKKILEREIVRKCGFEMLSKNVTKAEIARALDVEYKTVYNWELRLRKDGPDAWRDKEHPGPKRKLTRWQRRRLVKILLRGAKRYGFENDLWTLKRVAQVIKREFNVTYNVTYVWCVLRDLGFSAQVPLKQALERDEDYIKEWVEERWPEILKDAEEGGYELLFVDESGLSNEPNVARTWAPKGSRPKLKHSAKRRKLSIIFAITMDAELYFSVYPHDLTGAEVILFLDKLTKRIPWTRMMLLWDNAPIHRSAEVKEYLHTVRQKLETRRFPAYAPELNPDEYIFSHIKCRELANFCPESEGEMKLGLRKAIGRIMRRPQLIQRLMLGSPLFKGKI
jgi:transposase